MPKSTEFTLLLEDKPGALAKCCEALAQREINIVAFESFTQNDDGVVHLVVDNPTAARRVLDSLRVAYREAEVAVAKLPNRPGELARAASRLGENHININYAYCGLEPGTNAELVIFGVADANKATMLLEELSAKAA
jgi:hypothetical protein